ncbi:hypothetical protein LTS18_003249, partial [Coniosporium uncinatum]
YVVLGEHVSESKLPYWVWGIVGTLAMCILIPTSLPPLRQKMYEIFLAWHIIMVVFVTVGCYLYIYQRFELQWGYQNWILVAIAVWSFDRVARLARIARNGIRTAQVTVVDDDYIRVDVPGVTGEGHAYLYFPTLTWRVWENHPFSIASTLLPAAATTLADSKLTLDDSDHERSISAKDEVSATATNISSTHYSPTRSPPPQQQQHDHAAPTLALTFFVRLRAGTTTLLAHRRTLPVLVESGYNHYPDLSACPTLLCLVGGVGITATLPYLRRHQGRAKLFWGVRCRAIVDAMEDHLSGVEREVFVGRRLDVRGVIEAEVEASGKGGGGVVVVSCGPAGMGDEVRMVVCEVGARGGAVVKLVEESFSW